LKQTGQLDRTVGRDRTLRVIDTRLEEGTDGDPVSVLVVEAA
jgi:hypothetical protein